jgi:hypothetical protein
MMKLPAIVTHLASGADTRAIATVQAKPAIDSHRIERQIIAAAA